MISFLEIILSIMWDLPQNLWVANLPLGGRSGAGSAGPERRAVELPRLPVAVGGRRKAPALGGSRPVSYRRLENRRLWRVAGRYSTVPQPRRRRATWSVRRNGLRSPPGSPLSGGNGAAFGPESRLSAALESAGQKDLPAFQHFRANARLFSHLRRSCSGATHRFCGRGIM